MIPNVFAGHGMSSKDQHPRRHPMPINEEHKCSALNKQQLDNVLIQDMADECSLRVRIFDTSICCGQQPQGQLFASHLHKVDCFQEMCSEIPDVLANSKFIGYSCIVIIVHDSTHLGGILAAIAQNRYLRYKSKLILWRREEYLLAGRTQSHHMFESLKPENTIIFEWFRDKREHFSLFDYADIVSHTFEQPNTPIQKVLDIFQGTYVVDTTNAGLYVYSINPALAIIINNYYFTSPHQIRRGSDRDVVQLIRELKIAGVPYMLIEDSNRQDLLQILDYIEQKDFSPVKSFMIFLMSHGDSNVLYTHDGQLDINKDVVQRLQSNKSLTTAEKLIVVNACRGGIDLDWADEDDLGKIQSTENSNLAPLTVVWYSVPNGVQSLRCPSTGCPFIQSFCRHFRNIEPEDDIVIVDRKVDLDLKGIDYFYGLDKCSDLVLRNSAERHTIIQLPIAARQMLALTKSIAEDFPVREYSDHSTSRVLYIGGTLNQVKFPKTDVLWKYFAPDLDFDICSVDKDTSGND